MQRIKVDHEHEAPRAGRRWLDANPDADAVEVAVAATGRVLLVSIDHGQTCWETVC